MLCRAIQTLWVAVLPVLQLFVYLFVDCYAVCLPAFNMLACLNLYELIARCMQPGTSPATTVAYRGLKILC